MRVSQEKDVLVLTTGNGRPFAGLLWLAFPLGIAGTVAAAHLGDQSAMGLFGGVFALFIGAMFVWHALRSSFNMSLLLDQRRGQALLERRWITRTEKTTLELSEIADFIVEVQTRNDSTQFVPVMVLTNGRHIELGAGSWYARDTLEEAMLAARSTLPLQSLRT